jgi:uncharacterized membrane protein YqjE
MALPMSSTSIRLGVQGLTIESAIDHLVDAAQGVVENQLELARLDVEQTMARVLRSAVFVIVGACLLAGAAVALAMAAYAAMPDAYPPEQRLAMIAGVSGVLGIGLTLLGARRVGAHGRD